MPELPSVFEVDCDLNDAKPPVPLPVGEYRATVRSCEQQISKSSNKPMAVFTYYISPDQFPPDFTDGNPEGELLTTYVSLDLTNARNRYRWKQLHQMHGVRIVPHRIDLTQFLGRDVIVNVTHEEYQGEPRPRVNPIREA
jgi:hypothetical protein